MLVFWRQTSPGMRTVVLLRQRQGWREFNVAIYRAWAAGLPRSYARIMPGATAHERSIVLSPDAQNGDEDALAKRIACGAVHWPLEPA